VSQLTTLLRSFGNDGAVTNVQTVLESRQREDWVVEGLARRLDPAAVATVPATAAAAVPAGQPARVA
jgi:hypothetical protein